MTTFKARVTVTFDYTGDMVNYEEGITPQEAVELDRQSLIDGDIGIEELAESGLDAKFELLSVSGLEPDEGQDDAEEEIAPGPEGERDEEEATE